MKTLKRTLCLVLVLVMVAGLLSVCANAAFTDDGKITYKEAVGVMSGMGIIKGRDNGAFDPNGNVSRAEIATMIYKAVTGDSEGKMVGAYTSNKFKDVPANEWCAGYVSFAANKGIVVGDGDGNFRPYGQVTGYEALVMVIRALGYDAENAGKEITNAPDWKVAAIDRARALGIIGNILDVNYDKPITREVAAEIIYRAFMNDVVSYSKLLETYTPTQGSAYLLKNYRYSTEDNTDYVWADGVAYNVANDKYYADAAASTSAPARVFEVSAFADAGHAYKTYMDVDGNILYAEKISKTVVASDAAAIKGILDDDGDQIVIGTTKLPAAYTQGYVGDTVTLAKGDTVIYIPAKTLGNTQTSPIAIAIVKSDAYMDYVEVTYTPAAGKTPAYVEAYCDGALIFSTKPDAELDYKDMSNIDWASMVSATNRTVTKYYNTDYVSLTADPYDGIFFSPIQTVVGKVTMKNSDKLTVNGTTYTFNSVADDNDYTDLAGTGETSFDFTTTYEFYISGITGEIFYAKVYDNSETPVVDKGAVAYFADITEKATTTTDPIYGTETNTTYTYYAQIVLADGTYKTVEIATIGGKTLVKTLSTDAATAATQVTLEGSTLVEGFNYVKLNADGKADVYVADENIKTATVGELTNGTGNPVKEDTLNGLKVGNYYIDSSSAFLYVSNAGNANFKAELQTGKHLSKSVYDSVEVVYTTNSKTGISTVVMGVIDAAYAKPTDTSATTDSSDYYYVAKYLGQTSAGYGYTAYKVGSTTADTIYVQSQVEAGKLYKLTTTVGTTTTYTFTAGKAVDGDGVELEGVAYTVAGVTYLPGDIAINGACAFVNLTETAAAASVADLVAGDTVDYVLKGGSGADANTVIAIFVVGEAAR